jgi:hypothetical protein
VETSSSGEKVYLTKQLPWPPMSLLVLNVSVLFGAFATKLFDREYEKSVESKS